MTLSKECFGYISLAIVVIGWSPYLYFIVKGRFRPHAFSWIIWALVAAIVFIAQYGANAGPGAWATGLAAFAYLLVAMLAMFQGDRDITLADRWTFAGALLTIPLWYFTHQPLLAVLLAIIIDLLGYYPSFRKFYRKPYEEMIFVYVLGGLQYMAALFAMENYAWVTMLYPVFVLVANISMIIMLGSRRMVVSKMNNI